jgi:hypothetical protein
VERIEAYARLTGVQLTPWEVDTLLAIDDAVREVALAADKAKKKE